MTANKSIYIFIDVAHFIYLFHFTIIPHAWKYVSFCLHS